jgi:hypothetical protein
MIRHHTDATQWRNIDSQNPKFAIDPRNIRIAMSTDDMNPFLNSSTHSRWPIVLTILNLALWLCNKQKYIMMSGLILGSQQPGNDIDTYFRPLVEYLRRCGTTMECRSGMNTSMSTLVSKSFYL